jgi:proline dehydrogenase
MKLFDNTEVAFSLKSNAELLRANFLYKMIQNQALVRIGSAITNFALKANLPVTGIIRATVFNHFCGGVTEEDCIPTINKLHSKGVSSVLDYSVEGKEAESEFDETLAKVLKVINFGKVNKAIPFAVFKPTGLGRFALFQKITEKEALTAAEEVEWQRVKERFDIIGKAAHEKGFPLLVDGEESWMQDAADAVVEDLMLRYNQERPLVFNTLQMYRHDRLDYLKALNERALEKGFFIGMKVVRGAYMEKERERAEEKGYESPICIDKRATDENFDAAALYMMDRPNMALFAGTHNEHSTYLVMDWAKKYGIDKKDKNLWFGQLYGMSDNISFNLSNAGYNVAKYLPFGPVKDVMPYLIRRAEENTSVAGQTSRELDLISVERSRRKK